jgi:uncharacterized protein YcbK (DUF882 family)
MSQLSHISRIGPNRRELLIATGILIILGGRAMAAPSLPRRLKLKNVHTGESFEGPYRDAAGPIPGAISDLAAFLRDFHANKVGPVDVGALDFLADVMGAVGETTASVLSGYRTPETNEKLRATMLGVAEMSEHLYGRAIDVTFDRHLAEAGTAARRMARGGVGWYPRSHFIHLDSGPVRSWEGSGSDLELLLVGHVPQPLTVADRLKLQRSIAGAEHRSGLPPCHEKSAGVVVLRGAGCVP